MHVKSIFIWGILSLLLVSQISAAASYQLESGNTETDSSSHDSNKKVVILNFYDSNKNQFTNAKPILDKYGFKATFFIVCLCQLNITIEM